MHIDPTANSRSVILTGAGISVASGLRPYRGPGGIWDEADLARLEKSLKPHQQLLRVTQNIDGLHRRAGSRSANTPMDRPAGPIPTHTMALNSLVRVS